MPLELTLMSDGWCEQLELLRAGAGNFAASVSPRCLRSSDTRSSARLFLTPVTPRASSTKPAASRKILPVGDAGSIDNEAGGVAAQLEALGIAPADVRHVVVSHFHADHVGGLKDFPNANFHCSRAAFNAVKDLRGFGAVKHAFLPGLLPADFRQRAVFTEDSPVVRLPASHAPFSEARDLLGDGSLLAVDLPGHATGRSWEFFWPSTTAGIACWPPTRAGFPGSIGNF